MELFGFKFERSRPEKAPAPESFAPPTNDDGAISTVGTAIGGSMSHVLDLDVAIRSEADLITRYREISNQPIIERAIDDITNEAIVSASHDDPVAVDTTDLPYSDKVKELIDEEFKQVLHLLNFRHQGADMFRRWYIDGRMYLHVIINEQRPDDGILELRYIDPRRIRKVREFNRKRKDKTRNLSVVFPTNEYYVYSERGFSSRNQHNNDSLGQHIQGIKISRDSIIHCTSGRTDARSNMVLSHLHKAIRPLNLLLTMEDARVIYSMTRAPERRVWYIDVGGLPKMKADQHLRDMMVKHRNRLQYDASTGEIRDDRRFLTMLDDIWLPRRADGKATEVTTLPAGQGLGEIDEILYFRKNLYNALNIPVTRLEPDTGFSLGRATEISRDEVKFSKFVWSLRMRFGQILIDALIHQLLLKKVIGADDAALIRRHIQLRFAVDNHFAELKDAEVLRERLQTLSQIDEHIGKYFSKKTVWQKILRMTEEEIEAEKEQMAKEAEEEAPPEDKAPPAGGYPDDDQPGHDGRDEPYGEPEGEDGDESRAA